ncbi:MAG: hypothetical protein IMW85_00885 [Thermicanus sp.]|nr:hypothetical protein [Thermicanus sp.]
MIGSKRQEQETMDTIVIFDTESGMADIRPVLSVDHEKVQAEGYSVPIGDTKAFTGRRGRIFAVNAPADATSDYRRIAELEKSTVLRQITRYTDNTKDQPIDFLKYILIGIIAVMAIILALK